MSIDYGCVKKPQRQKLLELLSDLQWHSSDEIHEAGGKRAGARLLELKRQGYSIDSTPKDSEGSKLYRLMSLTPGKPKPKLVKVFLEPDDVQRFLESKFVCIRFVNAVKDGYASYQQNRERL